MLPAITPTKLRERHVFPSMFGLPSAEEFEWIDLDARNFLELARAGISALGPNWREDDAIHALRCGGGMIYGARRIPGTLDGEPQEFRAPISIRLERNGPLVVCQAQGAEQRDGDETHSYLRHPLR